MEAELDAYLVQRCRSGDRRAFEALYRRHRRAVMNLAVRLTRDRDLAADVVQETFIYFFRKIPTYRPEAKLSTLLFKVARNTSLSLLEKRRRGQGPSMDEVAEPAGTQDPAGAVETADLAARVRTEVDRLPDIYREVIVLRIIEGMSTKEIAQIAGCPEGTVKSRLHNGMALLRKSLGLGEPDGDSPA
jgi:RNA polymerase sigma-70 factor (ECF subfamily)